MGPDHHVMTGGPLGQLVEVGTIVVFDKKNGLSTIATLRDLMRQSCRNKSGDTRYFPLLKNGVSIRCGVPGTPEAAKDSQEIDPRSVVNYNGDKQEKAIEFKVLCTDTRTADGGTGGAVSSLSCASKGYTSFSNDLKPVLDSCICGNDYCNPRIDDTNPENYCGTDKDNVQSLIFTTDANRLKAKE